MRRVAAFVLLCALWPQVAGAQSNSPSGLQMLIQAGLVAREDPNLNFSDPGPGGTIGLVWTPWVFGGIWSEFGVMDVAQENSGRGGFLAGQPAFGSDTRFDQHLNVSIGGIISGSDQSSVCPFLRVGVGAFRVESDGVEPKMLASAPIEAFDSENPGRIHWTMGGTISGGARFGPSRWHAMPTLEGRVQIEPGANEAFISLLGGVWFR